MLTFVLGTRPERTKLRSLARECTRLGIPWQAVNTGQHTTLLEGFDHDPDFPVVHDLGFASGGDPIGYRDLLRGWLVEHLPRYGATGLLVQGDTATASAGALAGWRLGLPVYHVEAGLRTHDLTCPWPEEGFRVEIAQLATRHYCPTLGNQQNLVDEGVGRPHTVVVGNSGQDGLLLLRSGRPVPFVPKQEVLVTLHRRESHGKPLTRIVNGLLAVCQRFPQYRFLWPVHPNPAIQQSLPAQPPANLILLPPLAPETFTALLNTASAVLTDSGGVQEEAAFLGVPCVVAREKTDRPESVEAGLAILVGSDPDQVRAGLYSAITGGIRAVPSDCFGDGLSGERIVADLIETTTCRYPIA